MFLTVLFFCSWPCMMSLGACFLIWLSWAQHSSCEQRSPTHFQTLCFRQRLMPRYNINNDFLNCESCRAGTYGVGNQCNRSPLIKRTQANKKQPANPRRPTAHTHTYINISSSIFQSALSVSILSLLQKKKHYVHYIHYSSWCSIIKVFRTPPAAVTRAFNSKNIGLFHPLQILTVKLLLCSVVCKETRNGQQLFLNVSGFVLFFKLMKSRHLRPKCRL